MRVSNLLDPASAFLEIGAIAGHELYEDEVPCGGMIAGIGKVAGREVMVVCNDATVKGGTYYPITVKKHLRAQEIAAECRLPCIYLVDSGGANLPQQDNVFPDRDHFGRIFYNQARMSAAGIPQISAVMGSCTAGGAYVPAMSDVSIIVRNQGTIFLAGPPLVKAATGEVVGAEELGGGVVHASRSGVADYLAEDDSHALALARQAVGSLNRVLPESVDRQAPETPAYDPLEIPGIVPSDLMTAFDIREVIARVVDGSRFDEFKAEFGETLVTGFAHVCGIPVGVVANNGVLFSESALKGANFVELCSQRRISSCFPAEHYRLHGWQEGTSTRASQSMAPNWSTPSHRQLFPRSLLSLAVHSGQEITGMAGRAFQPRFLWSWPNSRISVMGGQQAAGVLGAVRRQAAEKSGGGLDEKQLAAYEERIRSQFDAQSHPLYASAPASGMTAS